MTETPSAACRQSSRESRSPEIISAFFPAGYFSRIFFRRSSLLDGRTKQRRLAKPYSSRISTTLAPMNPLEPVTKMRSAVEMMLVEFIRSKLDGKERDLNGQAHQGVRLSEWQTTDRLHSVSLEKR